MKTDCILMGESLLRTTVLPTCQSFCKISFRKNIFELLVFKVSNISNPALELFDARMGNRKAKPFRKTNCFEDS